MGLTRELCILDSNIFPAQIILNTPISFTSVSLGRVWVHIYSPSNYFQVHNVGLSREHYILKINIFPSQILSIQILSGWGEFEYTYIPHLNISGYMSFPLTWFTKWAFRVCFKTFIIPWIYWLFYSLCPWKEAVEENTCLYLCIRVDTSYLDPGFLIYMSSWIVPLLHIKFLPLKRKNYSFNNFELLRT